MKLRTHVPELQNTNAKDLKTLFGISGCQESARLVLEL
jgi:hypothetical protein